MKQSFLLFLTLVGLTIFTPHTAYSLTMSQFMKICESSTKSCEEQPLLNAYVGGALDVIAVLDEESSYLDGLYCLEPSGLFDVKAIIGFMQAHHRDYADKNAMLLVVRYLRENGGCQ